MHSASQNWTPQGKLQPLGKSPSCESLKRSIAEMITNITNVGMSYEDAIRRFQKRYILHILIKHKGHLGKTAEELQMHRNTLSRTLKRLGMNVTGIRQEIRRLAVPERRQLHQVMNLTQLSDGTR
jgi:Fis family transcriptional regulator, factor for inversion stimulation protein